MNQKNVLGRGLGALIPQKSPLRAGVAEIPLTQITANPYQPRKAFDEAAMEELARSVREHGIVQPVLVSRVAADKYQLVAGERRFRAAQRAGLATIPAVVKEALRGEEALEIALVENIQREDLNPLEEAVAYQQLHREFGLTQEEIARKVGKERSTVANFLRLLKLPEPVKELVSSGQLSMGHARALLGVESLKKLEILARRVVKRDLNVRQTEILVAEQPKKKKKEKLKDVFTRDAEEKLTRMFRTKVEIARGRRGGKITIAFGAEEELIRIYEDLTGHGRRR